MKSFIILITAASLLGACDVSTAPPAQVTEKNTTIVNPPPAPAK